MTLWSAQLRNFYFTYGLGKSCCPVKDAAIPKLQPYIRLKQVVDPYAVYVDMLHVCTSNSHLSKQVHTGLTHISISTNVIAYSPQDMRYFKAHTGREEKNEMILSFHYTNENKIRYFSCDVRSFTTAWSFGHNERLRNDQCDA